MTRPFNLEEYAMYLKKLPGYRKVPNSRMRLRFAIADLNMVEEKLDDPAFFNEFEKELGKLYPEYSSLPEAGYYDDDLGFNYHPSRAKPVLVCDQGILVLEPGQSIPGILCWHSEKAYTALDGYWVGYIDPTHVRSKFWMRASVERPSWDSFQEFYGMKLMESLVSEANILAVCRKLKPEYDSLPEEYTAKSQESSSWQHWNDRDA